MHESRQDDAVGFVGLFGYVRNSRFFKIANFARKQTLSSSQLTSDSFVVFGWSWRSCSTIVH